MSTMETPITEFRKFFSTPPAPAAFPSITATSTTTPTADGIIDLQHPVAEGPVGFNFGKFLFYASGTANSVFAIKLVKLTRFEGAGDWVPVTLASLECQLGATTRSTGERYVSGITVVSSLIVPNNFIWPADNGIQLLTMDLSGAQSIQAVPGPVISGTVTAIQAAMSGY